MTQFVKDLSEFALIDRLISALPAAARGTESVAGQQDDCAYWSTMPGRAVVTTDALVDGVHFRLDWTDWRSLGHKMLAVNLSDLASMGSTPTIALVTLALTGEESVAGLEEMYRGAGELAATYPIAIAGGDIVRTPGPMTISVTAFGFVSDRDRLMLRSESKPDDVIMVSGTLGASAAGLQLLQEDQRSAATAELLIGAHLRPSPRISLGQKLAAAGVRCCMDLSDGLSGDLPKILSASGVGARIDLDKIPVLPAVRALFPTEWQELALHGGEDYELLCTVPPEIVGGVIAQAESIGATLTPIGQIVPGDLLQYCLDGEPLQVREKGAWDHFGGRA